jgi:enoyl-CoA hydratase/carnithine racemase
VSTVLVEDRGAIRIITLNRPERLNAITPDMVEDLASAMRAANGAPQVRAIVLTGAGRAFCAGDDLHDFDAQTRDEATLTAYVEGLQQVTREMMFGRVPIVGAVRGWAVGGGFEWVFNCDLVVVSESARGFFPEMGLGLFVTGGITTLLPRTVGPGRARRLLLMGERVDSMMMLEWGIAQWRVSDEALLGKALEVAEHLTTLSERSVADLRAVMARVSLPELDAAIAAETKATIGSFADPDTARRVADAAP